MRTLLIFFITIFFALSAEAQYIDLRRVNAGAFVGPNIANYSMQAGEVDAGSRFGYQIGGFVRYGGRFFLQSGLTYFSHNSRLREFDPGNEDRVNVRILQLPVFVGANIYTMRRQTGKIRVHAGPAFSLLTSVRDNDLTLTRDDFSNVWLHGVAGVGLDVWFFSLDFGYQWGLNNAFSNDSEGRHNMATLSLGLTF